MSKEPKDLVPPLELCKKIPAGEFEDSAFEWFSNYHFGGWLVEKRGFADAFTDNGELYPAPTLQEIMAEIQFAQVSIFANGSFVIHPRFGKKRNVRCYDDNAATASLKLWLKLKGIEDEKKQG
jgi:hypothetical protein